MIKSTRADRPDDLETPFPLKRKFERRFIPTFLIFIAVFVAISGFTARRATESVYLRSAQQRADAIVRAVAAQAPEAWQTLMQDRSFATLGPPADILAKAFRDEMAELKLDELKVYDLERRVLFATDESEIGSIEDAAALAKAIANGDDAIATKTLPDGRQQYELYVPIRDKTGNLHLVFELYEPVSDLNTLMYRSSLPAMGISAALMLVLTFALYGLVRRAQDDINRRTGTINAMRARIESFVSDAAVKAARDTIGEERISSRRLVTTLLYSDIRGFTAFSEINEPEAVVDYLNEIMGLQVSIAQRHGGDIDKMIGDALLARFDGEDGPARAIAAAADIQSEIAGRNLSNGVGIGIYRGVVVSGAVGLEDRRDFTVIGDAVNMAARLCGAAAAGEIVCAAAIATSDYGPEESLWVKGHDKPVSVRRRRLAC